MSEDDKTTWFGFQKIPAREKAEQVAGVFHSVASQYDIMNDVMSLGTHRLMKQVAVEYTVARPGHCILDLAGGTGDLACRLSPIVGDHGQVVLCDINDSMLTHGRNRLLNNGISNNVTFVQADAEVLPFPDNTFNAITIGFGLRNFTDKQAAINATKRVLKPGGKLVILEFSRPENPIVRNLYDSYSRLWPEVGRFITGDRESYQYLVESIRMHPPQEEIRQMLSDAGYEQVEYHNILNGVAAIHVGGKVSDNACV